MKSRKSSISLWKFPSFPTNRLKALGTGQGKTEMSPHTCQAYSTRSLLSLQPPQILSATNSYCHIVPLSKLTPAQYECQNRVPDPRSQGHPAGLLKYNSLNSFSHAQLFPKVQEESRNAPPGLTLLLPLTHPFSLPCEHCGGHLLSNIQEGKYILDPSLKSLTASRPAPALLDLGTSSSCPSPDVTGTFFTKAEFNFQQGTSR